MAKGQDNTISLLITGAVLVILSVAFLASISDQTLNNTQKTATSGEAYNLTGVGCYEAGQVNESSPNCAITVTNAPAGWEQEDSDCYLSSVVVTNYTGTVLTLDTDYTVTTNTGVITLLNTSDTEVALMGDEVNFAYEYCGDGYMADSWGRTVLTTNVGLYVIAILIAAVALVYLLLKKSEE